MLYTTYFANMHKLPSNKSITKIIITRFVPKWFNNNKFDDIIIRKELAPQKDLLLKYKKDNNWSEFEKQFLQQIHSNPLAMDTLLKIRHDLQNGYDYALICYEKDYTKCHRYLLAKELAKHGIKWKEI